MKGEHRAPRRHARRHARPPRITVAGGRTRAEVPYLPAGRVVSSTQARGALAVRDDPETGPPRARASTIASSDGTLGGRRTSPRSPTARGLARWRKRCLSLASFGRVSNQPRRPGKDPAACRAELRWRRRGSRRRRGQIVFTEYSYGGGAPRPVTPPITGGTGEVRGATGTVSSLSTRSTRMNGQVRPIRSPVEPRRSPPR